MLNNAVDFSEYNNLQYILLNILFKTLFIRFIYISNTKFILFSKKGGAVPQLVAFTLTTQVRVCENVLCTKATRLPPRVDILGNQRHVHLTPCLCDVICKRILVIETEVEFLFI